MVRPEMMMVVVIVVATAVVLGEHGASTRGGDKGHRRGSEGLPPLPSYMLRLYERYQNGEYRRGPLQGNTVRSFLATQGKIGGNEVFLFNLSGLDASAPILRAELHFFHRGRRGRSCSDNHEDNELDGTDSHRLRLILLGAKGNGGFPLSIVDTNASSRGWQVRDVTTTVVVLRRERFRSNMLAARFETQSCKARFRPTPVRKFSGPDSEPFLIIFSNDSNSLDVLAGAAVLPDETPSTAVTPSLWQLQQQQRSLLRSSRREVRSVHDNRISEDDFGDGDEKNVQTTNAVDNELPPTRKSGMSNSVPMSNPRVLLPRPSSTQHPRRPFLRQPRTTATPSLRPFPDRHRRPKKQKQKTLPSSWQKTPRQSSHNNRTRHANDASLLFEEEMAFATTPTCQRRSMVVDFADIGWGDWIISPKSFEASYCAGTCSFPLTKNVRPSNHATIQSLVHAIGAMAGVPSPCCVPDVTSSLSLLYFDEDKNVVLKNYPAMTVKSCACR